MQISRFCLALCCIALLGGCTPKLAIDLFNDTGQSITVLENGRSIVIPAGEHKKISYFGSHREDSNLLGPTVQAGTHHWFYPVSTTQHGLLEPPSGYWRNLGLGRGLYVALDEHGYFYLLSSTSQTLASARVSQPSGFPLKPQ